MDMAPGATVPLNFKAANYGCYVERLPGDEGIARAARRCVTGLLASSGCPTEYVDDVQIMASELATNALLHGIRSTLCDQQIRSDSAEIWIYTRAGATGRELVIKVFDPFRGWGTGRTAGVEPRERIREHGRGLHLIAGLAQGKWGHHPTVSRQNTPTIHGKATWFAMPLPAQVQIPRALGIDPVPPFPTRRPVDCVHSMLNGRGVDGIIRNDSSTVSVLSLACGLTVWYGVHNNEFFWSRPDGDQGRWPACDLVEVCERIVATHAAITEVNAA